MPEVEIHQRESSPETENHLRDNGEKFNAQCVAVLRILYRGGRYTGKQINDITGFACGDRRLRDLFQSRKDIRREWVYSEDGKRTKWKEYFLDIPPKPTKQSLEQWWLSYLQENPNEKTLVQSSMF